jgi:hypothetical protein
MTCAIIIHNLVIDVEGPQAGQVFADLHTQVEEEEDRGPQDAPTAGGTFQTGEEKQEHLIEELLHYRQVRDGHTVYNK